MSDNQLIKNRLFEFIKFKNIRKSHFEKACGLSNGYVNSIVDTISVKKLENILKTYPELNKTWLITGQGEMLNGQNGNVIVGDNNIAHNISSNINSSATIDNLVALLEKTHQDNIVKDEQIRKKDEQIDRLLSLLERAQKQ